MQFELSQSFYFEAAHTLERDIEAESSRRVHGHTYHVEVGLAGTPDARTGMLIDLGHFRRELDVVRNRLDHHLLNEVPGLGTPTLESLCAFIARELQASLPGIRQVVVERRASGDRCTLRLQAG